MQNKNSFVLYAEYRQHLELLSDDECGRLFKAIMDFAATGDTPVLQGAEKMAFSFIQAQMERDNQKYKETLKKRSEAGKQGGRPQKQSEAKKANAFSEKQSEAKKANAFSEKQSEAKKANAFSEKQSEAKKANAFSEKQNEAKKAVYVDVDVDVDVKDIPSIAPDGGNGENASESLTVQTAQGAAQAATHSTTSQEDIASPPKTPTPSAQDVRFKEFWDAYPRKVGKKAARRSWDKIRPTAELHSIILGAITAQRKTKQWQKDAGQYIPHPTTWLNDGCWEDEVDTLPEGGDIMRAPNARLAKKLGKGELP